MKKIALTSLLAVFAASSAMAADHISNPMYRPDAKHFYSVTTVETTNEAVDAVWATEQFGYGITDRLAVELAVTGAESDWFNAYIWDGLRLGVNYRVYDEGNWKADLYGAYGVEGIWGHGEYESFMNKNNTAYDWTVGTRFGYVAPMWTVAGHIEFNYLNTESFNWDEKGLHTMAFGLDGFLTLNRFWNLVAGVEYNAFVDGDLWSQNLGYWTGKVGANFTIDNYKYIGVYVGKEMAHTGEGEWKFEDGYTFGAQFVIDF